MGIVVLSSHLIRDAFLEYILKYNDYSKSVEKNS